VRHTHHDTLRTTYRERLGDWRVWWGDTHD